MVHVPCAYQCGSICAALTYYLLVFSHFISGLLPGHTSLQCAIKEPLHLVFNDTIVDSLSVHFCHIKTFGVLFTD